MLKNKALILDRDGVINIDTPYVHSRQEFRFQDGIHELCRAAQNLGYLLLVVTNQSGIARGFYTESDFLELTKWMSQEFARRGVQIARVYYCPYHPVHGVGRYKVDSPDRKPRPGMFLRARDDFNLDLRRSVHIGDKLSDIEAARAAGVGTAILLCPPSLRAELAGYGNVSHSLDEIRSDFFTPSRYSAVAATDEGYRSPERARRA